MLAIAGVMKMKNEDTAWMVLVSGIGLVILSLLTPFIYTFGYPLIFDNMEPENISTAFTVTTFVINIAYAVCVGFIVLYVYKRPIHNTEHIETF